MGDSMLFESEYSKIPILFLSQVLGFADSIEYKSLNETEKNLPGIVAAAFTRFFVGLQSKELYEVLVDRDSKILTDSYKVIEQLSKSSDHSVKTLVEDEIFENVRASEGTWHMIESRFGPISKNLYDEWRKSNPR